MSILKRIFTRKYCVKCSEVWDLMTKLSSTKSLLLQMTKENDRIKSLLSFNNKNENIANIICFESELFVVTYNQIVDYKGRIKEIEYYGYVINNQHRFTQRPAIKMYCTTIFNNEFDYLEGIFIDDFLCDIGSQNKGYGSILMQMLINQAKTLKASYISGELSFVDIGINDNDETHKNNRERLFHFYPKFGFKIEEKRFKNGVTRKTIRLKL